MSSKKIYTTYDWLAAATASGDPVLIAAAENAPRDYPDQTMTAGTLFLWDGASALCNDGLTPGDGKEYRNLVVGADPMIVSESAGITVAKIGGRTVGLRVQGNAALITLPDTLELPSNTARFCFTYVVRELAGNTGETRSMFGWGVSNTINWGLRTNANGTHFAWVDSPGAAVIPSSSSPPTFACAEYVAAGAASVYRSWANGAAVAEFNFDNAGGLDQPGSGGAIIGQWAGYNNASADFVLHRLRLDVLTGDDTAQSIQAAEWALYQSRFSGTLDA